MSSPKDHNDEEDSRLDEFFKETLAHVRPYVLELRSMESAQLCKVWLDRLSLAASQRRLRNEYLMELCRQLKTGHIGGIFSQPPPKGFLLPLPKSCHMVCISSSLSDLSDYALRPHRSCLKSNAKYAQQNRQQSKKYHDVHSPNTSQYSPNINVSPTVRFHDENEKNQTETWEHREDKLNVIIEELQLQNKYLKKRLIEYEENGNNNADEHLLANISQLNSEVSTLKAKLMEIKTMKDTLEASHEEIVQQYYGTVQDQLAEFKYQLREARLRNETLDNNVMIMTEKLEEVVQGKNEEIKMMEKQWTDKFKIICQRYDMLAGQKNKELQVKEELLGMKDLELSQRDKERKREIELLTCKLQDIEEKLETKIKDESQLQAILADQYMKIKEEFDKIRNEVDVLTQKQNKNLSCKIVTLKKTIGKLERSKEKLGQDYENRILNILKNKNLEIKALQLQLKEQMNEICTSMNSEKQCEVDNIIALLEKRYKTLLAEAEATAENQNQEYLRKIALLEDQLLRLKRT